MGSFVVEFPCAREYRSDIWVADYTEQTKKELECNRKGVCISEAVFSDIDSFHLQNPKSVATYGVNFEELPSYFPEGVKNCECLFKAKEVTDGGFVLLCELKYCKLKNVEPNVDKAYKQLQSTWVYLKSREVFNTKHCRCFFNISIPPHSELSPFQSFLLNQNDILIWKKTEGVNLLGANSLLILDKGIIRTPKIDI